jgi:coenzyme F420-dependent glucose-6-phosphate dehydrogenase
MSANGAGKGTQMVRLGWKAGTEQHAPDVLLDYAIAAEEAGFDFVAASDHFHPWAEKGQACFVWSWLGAAAGRTKKISLGTSVTCPILRYHPAIVAQAAATIASLAPGRFFLGVGTGEALNEYSACAEWPSYKIRRTRLDEAMELIRALWSGEIVTHNGPYYKTRQAKLYTPPPRPVPLYISSMTPNSAHFAGEHGDGLITVGGEEPETYREIFKNFDAGASGAKKDPAKMPRMIELGVAYTDNEQEAVDCRHAFWAGTYIPALFTERIHTPRMSEQNGSVVGTDVIKQSLCISAKASDHIAFAQKYIDLGFDELIFHSAGPEQLGFIQNYGKYVLPQLRESQQTKKSSAA